MCQRQWVATSPQKGGEHLGDRVSILFKILKTCSWQGSMHCKPFKNIEKQGLDVGNHAVVRVCMTSRSALNSKVL